MFQNQSGADPMTLVAYATQCSTIQGSATMTATSTAAILGTCPTTGSCNCVKVCNTPTTSPTTNATTKAGAPSTKAILSASPDQSTTRPSSTAHLPVGPAVPAVFECGRHSRP